MLAEGRSVGCRPSASAVAEAKRRDGQDRRDQAQLRLSAGSACEIVSRSVALIVSTRLYLREMKAALLYADEVVVPRGGPSLDHLLLAAAEQANAAAGKDWFGERAGRVGVELLRAGGAVRYHDLFMPRHFELDPQERSAQEAASDELLELAAVDRVEMHVVPHGCVPLLAEPLPEGMLSALPDERRAVTWSARHAVAGVSRAADRAEVALAARLLGELPAFPDAGMADILDVRERLADSRVRFQAVMAKAGRDLAEVPVSEWAATVDAYRREHVEEPLLGIREQLQELGAIPALRRALKDKWAVPTVASLAIATAMLDPTAVVAIGTSSAGVALAAREAEARHHIRQEVRQQPFFYLHQIDAELSRRGRSRA